MHITFKTVDNDEYKVRMKSLQDTIATLRANFCKKYYFNSDEIIFIYKQQKLTDDYKTLEDYNISKNSILLLYVKPCAKPRATIPMPSECSETESSSDDDESSSDDDENSSDDDESSSDDDESSSDDGKQQRATESRFYNGAQLKQAMQNDPYIILNVLQLLSMSNPFILSYIATTPENVRSMLESTLNNPEFKLRVIVTQGMPDPITRALEETVPEPEVTEVNETVPEPEVTEVNETVPEPEVTEVTEVNETNETNETDPEVPETNQYLVDKANIEAIIARLLNPLPFEQVKEIYLFMDRKIDDVVQFINATT